MKSFLNIEVLVYIYVAPQDEYFTHFSKSYLFTSQIETEIY